MHMLDQKITHAAHHEQIRNVHRKQFVILLTRAAAKLQHLRNLLSRNRFCHCISLNAVDTRCAQG